MEELETARVIENAGFAGCAHARPNGSRQVLLVDAETLQKMKLEPGSIRENITTEGFDVNALQVGEKVLVGEVELLVSAVCEPCEQIEKLRPGLQEALTGQRGMLCRVISGGSLRPGDEIRRETEPVREPLEKRPGQ